MSAAYCRFAPGHPFHGSYHASEYGFPSRDDAVLFERLVLEINQAGLSWLTVLKKRAAFRAAFAGYDIDKVAAFTARDVKRLMNDEGIIRNRLKIEAVIENAKRLQAIRTSHGSFAAWLDAQHPLSKEKWVKLFKQTFRFTGGEIVGEFLMSLGYLKGAHVPSCPVHAQVAKLAPPWAKSAKKAGVRASA
jgi:DNA-3-methyladenine glycosylase I